MNKIILSIAVMLTAYGFAMCNRPGWDDLTYKPPTEEGESGLGASFEGKFTRYQKGQKHPGQTNSSVIEQTWSDTVWQNDRAYKQIIVWTNDEDYANLNYEVSDLVGNGNTIPASNISLRFGSYILGDQIVEGCSASNQTDAYIADALSTTPVTSVTSEDPIKIWVTVNTQKTTVSGKYSGTIKINSGTQTMKTLNIELLVANHILPDVVDWQFHLDLWQFPFELIKHVQPAVSFGSDQYYSLMEPIYKALCDAGQKAITTYIKDAAFNAGETMVKWVKHADGSWSFDYSAFDKHVEKLMLWGITRQINCFSLIGWNPAINYYDEASASNKTLEFKLSGEEGDLHVGDETYHDTWFCFLSSFKDHLIQKGWFEKTVLFMDEVRNPNMELVVNLIKEHDPNWKIGLAGNGLSAEQEQQLYDYSIFLTRESQKTTTIKTFYTSCSHQYPNNFVTASNSPAEMSWMGWHAAGAGYNGYLRWAADYWRSGDPVNARETGASAGDASMLYYKNNTSNNNDVVMSIRLLMLRDGIQDYEKIKILNNAELNTYIQTFNVPFDFPSVENSGRNAPELVGNGESLLKMVSL